MKSLLLVEDDEDLGSLIRAELVRLGFSVQWAKSLAESHRIIKSVDLDLAIVDLQLPDGQGWDLVGEMSVPVLMMSAQGGAENRLLGMEKGVIDFIPKPFLIRELMIKIQRALPEDPEIWAWGDIVLDMKKRTVTKGAETYFLNKRDYGILKVLIEKAPDVVSRDEILDHVYGAEQYPSHRAIDNAIVGLRQRLDDKDHVVIRSVRGEGYQWGKENRSYGK